MTDGQAAAAERAMNDLEQEAVHGEKEFLRFSRLNRTLHIIMIISFISLTTTGMTLKFAYREWAALLSRFFGGYETAGYIHRIAATAMVGIFIAHIVDLTKRKRREFGSWNALILGPDSIGLAHQVDECMSIEEMTRAVALRAQPRRDLFFVDDNLDQ